MAFDRLKRRVVSGVFVTAGAQVLRQALQLGAVVVLARLLAPDAFGLLALAAANLAFLQLLADLGLGVSVERERELTPEQDSTLLLLSAGIAVLLGAGIFLAAPRLAALFGVADLAWVLRALAPCFLIAGALRTRSAVLARALRFRALAFVELFSVVAGAATSITLAMLQWGPVALVVGAAAQQLAWAAATIRLAGLPAPLRFRLAAVRPFLGFGGYLTAFNVLNFFVRKLDDLLVGGLMGVAALGLYEKSYALMMLPVTQLSAVIGRVLYPALSKVKDEQERFAFLYLGAVRKIAGLAFPLAAVCIACAGPIVRLVLGAKFEGAVPIFGTLALVMAMQPLMNVGGWLFLARARMRLYLAWGVIGGAVVLGAFALGARLGSPLRMAQCYAVATALLFLPCIALHCRVAGVPLRRYLARIRVPVLAAAAAWAAVQVLPALPFPATFAAMAVFYSAVHVLLDRPAFLDLFRFLHPRRAFES